MKTERHRTPWFDQDGYRACTAYYDDGSTGTVYEHRELMEQRLGRKLSSHELVHHKNECRSDNRLSNLEIKTRVTHARDHALERAPAPLTLICLECTTRFNRKGRLERHNRKQGKVGPFCGRSCGARWAAKNRLTGKGSRKISPEA